MPTAVVTGANSGIGHAFAKILLAEDFDVYACDVNVGENMKQLKAKTFQLDVSSPDSIKKFKGNFEDDQAIDLILNVAGIMSGHEEDSLENIDLAKLQKVFGVNTFGPLLLTQALLPNLLLSENPRLGTVSSRVGSIADNTTGGIYAYRSSKAAVNSIFRSMAMDLKPKGVVVVLLHPGYVKTGLDPSTHGLAEAVEPDEAAEKLIKVLMVKSLNETGRFWHREGQELPW
ncbi:hypothetical protein LTS18_005132 [Coniosporium uncinatum]|uniref:Uncharacterized protein n=1 Tax=Coniosporium uncinatum TaxID=93489 RepID=A0ACC3DRG7_9PEZI|nr:hypothetical protein LTS18_005132 [Coniosporium uncinatum]